MKKLKINITDGKLIVVDRTIDVNEKYNSSIEPTLKEYNLLSEIVEKGRTRLLNQQTAKAQENQTINTEISGISFKDSEGKKYQFNIENIERNRKIVDEISVRIANYQLILNVGNPDCYDGMESDTLLKVLDELKELKELNHTTRAYGPPPTPKGVTTELKTKLYRD